MGKNYMADKVTKLIERTTYSTPADPVINGDGKYRIAYKVISGVGKNESMIVRKQIEQYYGSPQDEPYTAKEVGDAIKNFSNLNTVTYNDIKQLYLDLLNEDIT